MTPEELTLQQNKITEARKNINTALGTPSQPTKIDAARDNKDPSSLGSWEERGASVEGKVQRLKTDPRFQKLSGESQDKLLNQVYDKYVPQAYQQFGKKPPDRDTWLAGVKSGEALAPQTYGQDKTQQKIEDFAMGAYKEANSFSLYGAKIAKENFLRSYGLGILFGLPPIAGHRDFNSKPEQALKNATDTVFNKWQKSAQNNVNDANYYFATHPRDGLLGNAARWTGEQVVSLPLYVSGVGEELLTERLLSTAVGKVAAHGIDAGFTNLATSMMEGGRTTPNVEDVAAGVTGAVVGGLIGAGATKLFEKVGEWLERAAAGDTTLKVANDAAIKEWSAEHIVTGGDPLAQASVHAASEELRTPKAEPPPKTTGVEPPPKVEEPVSTRMPPGVRKDRDPVLHSLIEGDKLSLQSIALRHYGMPYEKLSSELQDKVDVRRLELMEESKYELPIFKPELNKQEIAKEIVNEVKNNPYISKRAQQYKELFGTDYVQDATEHTHAHEVEEIAKQTGVKNPIAAADKLVKPESGEIKVKLGPKPPVSKRISPEKLAANKSSVITHFKDPVRSVGADINYKNLDTTGLIGVLKAADKDFLKFEDPFHRMLYHWDNRADLPGALRDKLRNELKAHLRNKYSKQSNLVVDLDKYADRARLHLEMLAKSGRLTADKNMFRSTNLFGAPTRWQTALNTEIDLEELATLRKTLKRNPDALSTVDAFTKILQSNRAEGLVTPQQWRDYNHAIDMVIGGEPKKAKAYSQVLEEKYATVPR